MTQVHSCQSIEGMRSEPTLQCGIESCELLGFPLWPKTLTLQFWNCKQATSGCILGKTTLYEASVILLKYTTVRTHSGTLALIPISLGKESRSVFYSGNPNMQSHRENIDTDTKKWYSIETAKTETVYLSLCSET